MKHDSRYALCRDVILTLSVLCLTVAVHAQARTWKSYSYAADGFSVSFPTEPILSQKDIPTEAGTFELRSYMAQDSSAALFIGVCDYGTSTEGADPEAMLDAAKGGALANSNSHLVSGTEKKITLGANHGLTFESESDSAHFTARIYLVGTTLYQILVVTPISSHYADTTKFLDSFQIIQRTHS